MLRNNEDRIGFAQGALLIVALAATLCVLYRDRYSASDLAIVPDSVEYAVAAHNLVTTGEYKIVIGGRDMLPRYPPWFSLLFIGPAYTLLGPDLGNAVFPVTALALVGIAAAFALGRRISGAPGGLLSAVALISLPLYRQYAREVMTDVPCSALLLILCLIYLRLWDSAAERDGGGARTGRWVHVSVTAGLLTALCAAVRPPFICAVLPFLFAAPPDTSRRRATARIAMILIPPAAVVLTTLAYNNSAFGSAFRSGYHFWCTVPYDFPGLTMSLRYLGPNLVVLGTSGLGACIVLSPVLALCVRSRPSQQAGAGYCAVHRILIFATLAAGPATLFHLVYFYPDARFFLPVACLTVVPAAGVAARLLTERTRDKLRLVAPILVSAALIAAGLVFSHNPPTRRLAADRILAHTPENAMIISAIDPAYLEFMVCRSSHRIVLPMSRSVEYASKVMAPTRPILHPAPVGWTDYNRSRLLSAGALEPVPNVAMGSSPLIRTTLEQGMPVYIETGHMAWHEALWLNDLNNELGLVKVDETLYQVRLP